MEKDIRLDKVHIDKLFHRFTYDLDFRNNQDVSILIAPNGCGKTTIFNLIDFIFNPTLRGYKNAITTPFENFVCILSNGNSVTLKKQKVTHKGPKRAPCVTTQNQKSRTKAQNALRA